MSDSIHKPIPQSSHNHWQLILFLLTCITTTLSGAEWIYGRMFFFDETGWGFGHWLSIPKLLHALQFSIPFLGILTIHEMGHYFTARLYKIRTTLPYYIPMWFGLGSTIGTMGAFIRIKDRIRSRKEFFDVGIAGPLAGFIAALLVLWYGFTHLPPATYIFDIHPEYKTYGLQYANYVYQNTENAFAIGHNLIFYFFEEYVCPYPDRIPNPYEMMHYPILFAGYLACFFTALNLMPIGQLDGGHILYGLIGAKWHRRVSSVLFVLFVYYAGLGIITPYQSSEALLEKTLVYLLFLLVTYGKMFQNMKSTLVLALFTLVAQFGTCYLVPMAEGYNGWLVFALILGRFLGIYHPSAHIDTPLDWRRKILGWLSLVIFVLCFSPVPFIVQ